MDERRECVYGPPPIRNYKDKPQPTVYGPTPIRKGCAKWLLVLMILAAICTIIVLLLK